ncbi:FKBP-type peptidyl-prolyl cis-trans isomerase [Pigmentiphaga soli]|uniref:Peptidyl-prolyl cis-trans isomerase n=1 Tax=Pigmentiphaga soli TaxID=1007095 RepID=A0ABP8HHF7_9BURK
MTSASADSLPVVREDSYVTLHYRISLASGAGAGEVFADTFTGRPATLQMGAGQWAPGMEAGLLGHAEGESFSIELPPAQAYGDRNPELIQRVTLAMLREHAGDEQFEPGDLVEFAAPNGGRYSGVFKEMGDGYAVFDFNHPLAGSALKVDVAILGVL